MRYLHYDVFTDTPFEGNQLAVFPDARGLSAEQMQTLAREMNFSESTFILPAETARHRHPDANLHAGRGAADGRAPDYRQHVCAGARTGDRRGPRSVRVRAGRRADAGGTSMAHDALEFAWMDQRPPEVRAPAAARLDIVEAAGVDPAAVDRTGLPIEEISCGVPFIYRARAPRAPPSTPPSPTLAAMRGLKSAFPGNHIGVFVFSDRAGRCWGDASTAGCSRPASAFPRTPPPAARAGRWAAISSGTSWCPAIGRATW